MLYFSDMAQRLQAENYCWYTALARSRARFNKMAGARSPQPVPDAVLRGMASQFDAAASGHADVAERLIIGLSCLIATVESYLPAAQAELAGELAASIGRAVPAIEAHSVAGPELTATCAHGAMSLAALLGQTYDRASAVVASGQADTWLDLVGLQRAGLEAVWRSARLAKRLPIDEPSAIGALTALVVGTKH